MLVKSYNSFGAWSIISQNRACSTLLTLWYVLAQVNGLEAMKGRGRQIEEEARSP